MAACEQRKKLLRTWRDSLMILAEGVSDLEILDGKAFEHRLSAVILARDLSDDAYAKFVRHRLEHEC